MTLQEFLGCLAEYAPSAQVIFDGDGQVVIATGMAVRNGELEELATEEV
jgi:hypothetical protein